MVNITIYSLSTSSLTTVIRNIRHIYTLITYFQSTLLYYTRPEHPTGTRRHRLSFSATDTSSICFGKKSDGAIDRNSSEGRGGALPHLGEIRNCHINIGTGKEITIKQLSELVANAVNFKGEIVFDSNKPNGTPRKLVDVSKLHSLGWKHQIEINEGVNRLFQWYRSTLA